MLYNLLGILSSYASLIGLIYSLRPSNGNFTPTQEAWLGVTVIACLLTLSYEALSIYRNMPRTFRSTKKINEYMYKWIGTDGQVAIFSRDMSWASDESIRELLIDKASRNELSIYVPRKIPLVQDLQSVGAHVFTYDLLDYEPTARFTIVKLGREGSQVAIGRGIGQKHRIDEYSAGDHPVYYLAHDMIEVIKRVSRLNAEPTVNA